MSAQKNENRVTFAETKKAFQTIETPFNLY